MPDPDWTAEFGRDVRGARGVDVSMHLSLFFIFQIFRPYVVHASRLFEKSCTRHVLLFLSPAVNVFSESFPLFFFGGLFVDLYFHDLSVRLDVIRLVLFLRR